MARFELTDAIVDHYKPIVEKVARIQWKQATVLEVGDIEQALWEALLTEGQHIFFDRNGTPRDDDSVEGLLHRKASTFCRGEREDFQYFTGAFVYSGDEVAALLKEQVWVKTEDVIDIEGRLDMMAAFEKLSPSQQRALYKAYALKGEKLSDAERKAQSRGLLKITTLINSGFAYERLETTDAAVEARLQGVAR